MIPPRPPAFPAIPDNAAAGVRKTREAEHAILVQDHASYNAAECVTAEFIGEAVNEIWYRNLLQSISFYTTVKAMTRLNVGGYIPVNW